MNGNVQRNLSLCSIKLQYKRNHLRIYVEKTPKFDEHVKILLHFNLAWMIQTSKFFKRTNNSIDVIYKFMSNIKLRNINKKRGFYHCEQVPVQKCYCCYYYSASNSFSSLYSATLFIIEFILISHSIILKRRFIVQGSSNSNLNLLIHASRDFAFEKHNLCVPWNSNQVKLSNLSTNLLSIS